MWNYWKTIGLLLPRMEKFLLNWEHTVAIINNEIEILIDPLDVYI
jgi:hypothetical protein